MRKFLHWLAMLTPACFLAYAFMFGIAMGAALVAGMSAIGWPR